MMSGNEAHALQALRDEQARHQKTAKRVRDLEHTLHDEERDHAKTVKQLTDMQAVLGCIQKRVERFNKDMLPGYNDLLGMESSALNALIVDLERMLGVENEKE